MCMQALSPILMEDEGFQTTLAEANLDLVHQQVLMTLYTMDVDHRLDECKDILPIYLAQPWEKCSAILDTLAAAGLISRDGDKVSLIYRVEIPEDEVPCGCATCG